MREELTKLGVEAGLRRRLRVPQNDSGTEEQDRDEVDDQARPGTERVKHPSDQATHGIYLSEMVQRDGIEPSTWSL